MLHFFLYKWNVFEVGLTPSKTIVLFASIKPFKNDEKSFLVHLKGILTQIWISVNIFVFIEKLKNFILKHLLLFEIYACEISAKFVYKHSETIEYVKN